MKTAKQIIGIAVIYIFLLPELDAQSDSTKSSSFQIKISANYNSALNYYGRTDSLKSSGFFPLAEIWIAKDFYINAAPVFINNSSQAFNYAGTVASTGYQHIGKSWLTNIFIVKPFYNANSQLVQAALKEQAGINISYLNKIVNITAGADLKYSNKADYGLSAGMNHIIKITREENIFIIDPTVTLSAGTQNFTNTYFTKKNGFLLFPGIDQQVSENMQHFNLLAVEVSIPLIYVAGKFQIFITTSYIQPEHLIIIPGHPESSEIGSNLFYGTIAIKYIL